MISDEKNTRVEPFPRERESTEPIECTVTPNDAEDSDQENDIGADVMPIVVEAYVADQGTPSVIGTKETCCDKLRHNSLKYSAAVFITLTIAGIIQILLVSSGLYRENKNVNRQEYLQSLAIEVSGKDAFQLNQSPQSIALRWMQEKDQLIIPFDQKSAIIQRYVSAVIYFGLGGPYWYHNHTFINGTTHECEWNEWKDWIVLEDTSIKEAHYSRGFHCRNNNTITDVILFQMNLTGSIPTEIGLLSDLLAINTGYNMNVRGTIPSEIGLLKDLMFLFIYDNDLHGKIPNEIQTAESLNVVLIFGNKDLSDNLDPICAMESIAYVQADCGNGTSKIACDCCNVCCNTDIRKCCAGTEGTTGCFSIDLEDELVFT